MIIVFKLHKLLSWQKGDATMIACSQGCVYQTEGVCMFDRACSMRKADLEMGCIYYVPRHEIPNTPVLKNNEKL